jgi:hypothetical protein
MAQKNAVLLGESGRFFMRTGWMAIKRGQARLIERWF